MSEEQFKLVVSIVGFLTALAIDDHPEERELLEKMDNSLRAINGLNPNERIQEDG